jgi:hypothetical protein
MISAQARSRGATPHFLFESIRIRSKIGTNSTQARSRDATSYIAKLVQTVPVRERWTQARERAAGGGHHGRLGEAGRRGRGRLSHSHARCRCSIEDTWVSSSKGTLYFILICLEQCSIQGGVRVTLSPVARSAAPRRASGQARAAPGGRRCRSALT